MTTDSEGGRMSAAEVIEEWRRMYGDDLAAEVGPCTVTASIRLHGEVQGLRDGNDWLRRLVRSRTRRFWRKFRVADEKQRKVRDE